jgi:hypothetical protein
MFMAQLVILGVKSGLGAKTVAMFQPKPSLRLLALN